MRLITYVDNADPRHRQKIGAWVHEDSEIVPLTDIRSDDPDFASMLALIEAGDSAWARARDLADGGGGRPRVPTREVTLLAPVPVPQSIRDWACFPDHLINIRKANHRLLAAKEADPAAAMARFEAEGRFALPQDYYELPRFHSCNRFSVVAPDSSVEWPPFTADLDFELEFGFYIAKKGKRIAREEAQDYIFGYTIFNDYTARDLQRIEARVGGKCKEFDGGNVMGPCVVTADEIPDPYNLRMTARVNGTTVCDSSSSTIGRDFAQVISHLSESTTIHPGEFFGSGTVGGGCGAEFNRSLSPGDVVELEVEKIGVLRSTVVKIS